jgi:hypothetical protein
LCVEYFGAFGSGLLHNFFVLTSMFYIAEVKNRVSHLDGGKDT